MKTIMVSEEFKLPGTDIVLEEGDKVTIHPLDEAVVDKKDLEDMAWKLTKESSSRPTDDPRYSIKEGQPMITWVTDAIPPIWVKNPHQKIRTIHYDGPAQTVRNGPDGVNRYKSLPNFSGDIQVIPVSKYGKDHDPFQSYDFWDVEKQQMIKVLAKDIRFKEHTMNSVPIRIEEEIRIPDTDVILEKGDQVVVREGKWDYTNLADANSYYRVEKPFKATIIVGSEASGSYYGSSQLYRPTYKEIVIPKGWIIMNLAGGTFLGDPNTSRTWFVRMTKAEWAPFEKNYSGVQKKDSMFPLDYLTQLPNPVKPKDGKWLFGKTLPWED